MQNCRTLVPVCSQLAAVLQHSLVSPLCCTATASPSACSPVLAIPSSLSADNLSAVLAQLATGAVVVLTDAAQRQRSHGNQTATCGCPRSVLFRAKAQTLVNATAAMLLSSLQVVPDQAAALQPTNDDLGVTGLAIQAETQLQAAGVPSCLLHCCCQLCMAGLLSQLMLSNTIQSRSHADIMKHSIAFPGCASTSWPTYTPVHRYSVQLGVTAAVPSSSLTVA